ncbi:MAG TPA: dihydrofolate reductase family protein, partial [Phycicoccus sp.]
SLDGYVVDADGDFSWAAPTAEVHAAVNDLERPLATQLLGRRMYEVLAFWEDPDPASLSDVEREYARIWQDTDKVVYSSTLPEVATARTRLERRFDPEAVAALVARSEGPVGIGGPTLAAEAFRAGLVDEVHLFLVPHTVGGGTPALPPGQHVRLHLEDVRSHDGGVVHLHHRVVHEQAPVV